MTATRSAFVILGNRCTVTLETAPAQGSGTKRTVDLAPMPADAVEVSFTGTIAANDGGHSAGQCLGELRRIATEAGEAGADVVRLCDLWSAHHLNGMNAGTRAQREALADMPPAPGDHYTAACAWLAERGLYEVDGYTYGGAWLYAPVPAETLEEARAIMARLDGAKIGEGEAPATMAEVVERLGLTMRADFVPWSQSRHKGEKRPSLNWLVTIERNGRAVVEGLDYGEGSARCPASTAKAKAFGRGDTVLRVEAIKKECETGYPIAFGDGTNSFFRRPGGKPITPDVRDVLSCLVNDASVLDAGGFESWAADFGYEPDSRKAETIYRACLDIALKLRAGIGEDGLTALRNAAQSEGR